MISLSCLVKLNLYQSKKIFLPINNKQTSTNVYGSNQPDKRQAHQVKASRPDDTTVGALPFQVSHCRFAQ